MKKDTTLSDYIKKVEQMVSSMSTDEKDSWIITQAKLANSEDDFIQCLSGEKKIQSMLSNEEIQKYCEKIKNKEIYLIYETHYVECFEFGYQEDFEDTFHDPFRIISFFDNVLFSCHKLMELGEYSEVYNNISQLLPLKVEIHDHEDSEDLYQGDYPFTIAEFFNAHLLSVDREKVVYDLILSFYHSNKNEDVVDLADKVIKLFLMSLCDDIIPSQIFAKENEIKESYINDLFVAMKSILKMQILSLSKIVNDKNFERWRGDNNKTARKYERYNELLNDVSK